jgi:hypothetical protein
MKRFFSIVAALVIATAGFLPSATPAKAATPTYSHDCDEDPFNYLGAAGNYKIFKSVSPGNIVKGVSGDILNVNNLFNCTNPMGITYTGQIFVLAANLQQGDSAKGIVQIGVYEDNQPSGTSVPKFAWTDNDCNYGNLNELTWAETPQYTHNYGFAIEVTTIGGMPIWKYKIWDNTDGQYWENTTHRTWNKTDWGASTKCTGSAYGNVTWWGYENTNEASLMGRKDTDGPIQLYHPQYWNKDTGNWVAAWSAPLTKLFLNDQGNSIPSSSIYYPDWYHVSPGAPCSTCSWWAYTVPW